MNRIGYKDVLQNTYLVAANFSSSGGKETCRAEMLILDKKKEKTCKRTPLLSKRSRKVEELPYARL
jgi:hypothetical protein